MKKTKTKKATAGQRFVGIPDYCHTAEEAQAMVRAAQAIDRAIAAAVRKERQKCIANIRAFANNPNTGRQAAVLLEQIEWIIECRGKAAK